MIVWMFVAVLCGITAGIFTGLIPGLHVNLITAVVVSSAALVSGVHPFLVAVFIVSLALTHSFLDSIPSIYLGAPDESQVVAVLPGHQMLLAGKGHQAILYTIVGSLAALLLTLLCFPFGLRFLGVVQPIIQPYIGKFLLLVVIVLIILSKKYVRNALFFLAAGLLGLLCFGLPQQDHILLPLLSGLFGTSTLLLSLVTMSSLPSQQLNKRKLDLHLADLERNTSRATLVGLLASFLPGFGSSQAAIVASATMKQKSPKDYLLLVGGINTVNFTFSLVTVAVLDKARNGAIVGVKSILGTLTSQHLLFFVPVLLIVAGNATLLGVNLSRLFAKYLCKLNYKKLVLSVILFLFLITALLAKPQGVIILLTATALGILASVSGAQKNMLLGCLLLPVIFYLW